MMQYLPLSDDGLEIRTLTILPLEDGATNDSLIQCRLQHVQLKTKESRNGTQVLQTWPETHESWDESSIFKDKQHPLLRTTPLGRDQEIQAANRALEAKSPWRYEWGDYAALSYVWGPSTPSHDITINDYPFTITENLYQALRQLRQSQRVRQGLQIWVDAICINQNDLDERSRQVARMREIYIEAWQVIIWLGTEADDSQLGLTAIHWMSKRFDCDNPLEGFYKVSRTMDARPLFIIWSTYQSPLRREVYRALFHLLTRPYWHRLWILQEVAMARDDAPVVCGNRCVTWLELYKAVSFIAADEERLGRDIVGSMRPRLLSSWSFEFGRDRVAEEREWASERMWLLLMQMMKLQRDQRRPQLHENESDVMAPLILGRDAEVTDPKDRVYGVLGFRVIAMTPEMKPDYRMSLSQIYQAFTEHLLLRGDLGIIRLIHRPRGPIQRGWDVGNVPTRLNHPMVSPILGPGLKLFTRTRAKENIDPPCMHALPSWVVCWACRPDPVVQLKASYSAGITVVPVPKSLTIDSTLLTVKGVLCDAITSLSSFHPAESDSKFSLNTTTSETVASTYGDITAIREALWRTIIANSTREGTPPPDSYAWLLNPKIWMEGVAGIYTNGFGLNEFMSRNRKLILCDYTLETLIHSGTKPFWRNKQRIYNPSDEQQKALSWAMNVLAWRRLFGTDQGRMGLGPAATEPGDRIAVIVGCSVPIVLRKNAGMSSKTWAIVGECYLHGIMNGEVMHKAMGSECGLEDIQIV